MTARPRLKAVFSFFKTRINNMQDISHLLMKKIFTIFLLLFLCFSQFLGITFSNEDKDVEVSTEEVTTQPKGESEGESQQLSMSAEEALQEARALAQEARETYSEVAFSIDQPLWRLTLQHIDFALSLEANNLEVLRFAVETYVELGWHSRVWLYWERYLEAGGERDPKLVEKVGEAATELGYSRYKSGDIQGALDYYEETLEKDPNNSGAIVWLARIYFEQGQPEKALPLWQIAAKDKLAESADYFLERTQQQITYGVTASNAFNEGMTSYEKGDLVAAQQEFSEATEGNADFQEAWTWLGRTSLELQQPRVAEQAWRKVTELAPNDGNAKYFLQVATEQLNWGILAATAFREGITLYNQGSLSEANARFVASLTYNPNYLDAAKWAARTYQEAEDNSNAIRYWRTALNIDPNDEAAKYFLSTLLSISNNPYDTRPNLNSLDNSQVNNPFDKGLESYQLADFEVAKEYFLLATKQGATRSEAWGWLGRIHFEQNNYKEALRYYKKALKFDPNNKNFAFFMKESKKLLQGN